MNNPVGKVTVTYYIPVSDDMEQFEKENGRKPNTFEVVERFITQGFELRPPYEWDDIAYDIVDWDEESKRLGL